MPSRRALLAILSLIVVTVAGAVVIVAGSSPFALNDALVRLGIAASPVRSYRTDRPITIDGTLSEWGGVPGTILTRQTAEFVEGIIAGTWDTSGVLFSMWDDQYVYIAIDVSDNVLISDSTNPAEDDSIYITIDGRRDRYCCDTDDHQLVVALDGRVTDFGTQAASSILAQVRPRVGGYVVEMAIPISLFSPGPVRVGGAIYFTLGINDDDDGGRRDKRLQWSGRTADDYSNLGDLIFSGAVPSPTPTIQVSPSPAATLTPLATKTPTATPSAVVTVTATWTPTATRTQPPSPIGSPTATRAPTDTPTATQVPGSPTATVTPGGSADIERRISAMEGMVSTLEAILTNINRRMEQIGWLPAGTPTPLPTPTPQNNDPQGVDLRVNAGGAAYADGGVVWASDQPYSPGGWGYVGGATFGTTTPINGTSDQPLYQTERYGMSAYLFDVPIGMYEVTLKFAEIYQYAKPGGRIFDVRLEGQTVIAGLDLFSQIGPYTAYDQAFTVPVYDGQLAIEFVSIVGQPKVNAIRVRGMGSAGPTPTPSLSERTAALERRLSTLEQLWQRVLSVFGQFRGF